MAHIMRMKCKNREQPWRWERAQRIRYLLREQIGAVCAICGKPIQTQADVTLDHIYPRSRGGDDGLKNLQFAHSKCNTRKADLVPWPYCRPQEHPWESFDETVYGVVRRIPRGRVATYRQVAEIIGGAYLAGAVALALRRAPVKYPHNNSRGRARVARRRGAVPCHRVVGEHGELADYLGANGAYDHRKMLRREKITIYGLRVRLGVYGW